MAGDFSRLKIMVVDPNQHMRMLVKGVLHALGVKDVRLASDSADAFQEWKTFPADIIITEFRMEPLDGVEFTKLVRTASDSPNPYVPVIMLTSYTETSNVVAARDAGITEFVSKPISAQSLHARLHAVIFKERPFVRTKHYFGPDRRRRSSVKLTIEDRRQADMDDGDILDIGLEADIP